MEAIVYDPDFLMVAALSAAIAVAAICVMLQAARHRALGLKRAAEITLLASAAILCATVAVVWYSGYWHVGTGTNGASGFVFWVILLGIVPLSTWIVLAALAVAVLKFRSRIATATETER